MTQRLGRLASAMLVLTALAAMVRADSLEEAQKKIVEAAEKVKSFTADVTMVIDMKMESMTMAAKGQGTCEYLRKGDKHLNRMELKTSMTQKMGDQETKLDTSILSVTDGEFTYTLSEQGGMKTAIKGKLDKEPGVATKDMFKSWTEDNEVKLLPDEKVDGKDAYVFELTPKKPGPMSGKQMHYYSKEAGMLLKQVSMTADGKPMQTVTLTNVKMGADIKPERFVFKAPEGVEVMDTTKAEPAKPEPAKPEPAKP